MRPYATSTYIHTSIYMHACMYMYVCMSVYVCMYTCMLRAYACILVCMYIFTDCGKSSTWRAAKDVDLIST